MSDEEEHPKPHRYDFLSTDQRPYRLQPAHHIIRAKHDGAERTIHVRLEPLLSSPFLISLDLIRPIAERRENLKIRVRAQLTPNLDVPVEHYGF